MISLNRSLRNVSLRRETEQVGKLLVGGKAAQRLEEWVGASWRCLGGA